MIKETNRRVKKLISELHCGNHKDDMTQRWLCQTPSTPRTPTFYTLTKIHKPIPVGRPIISGSEGPTERLSSVFQFKGKDYLQIQWHCHGCENSSRFRQYLHGEN